MGRGLVSAANQGVNARYLCQSRANFPPRASSEKWLPCSEGAFMYIPDGTIRHQNLIVNHVSLSSVRLTFSEPNSLFAVALQLRVHSMALRTSVTGFIKKIVLSGH